jgi:cytochrome b
MNDTSASPVKPLGTKPDRTTLVWDAPVRVFHWLMVLSFAGAYLTAESERWRLVHVTLGYTMAGLVAFRIIWGIAGTPYARFVNFLRGPFAVLRYVRSIAQGRPERHVGHNPAGALAIVGLLALTLAVAGSGYGAYTDVGGDWLEEVHEVLANAMLGLVGLHIVGVVLSSWLHRENLVAAMIDGRKAGESSAEKTATGKPWYSLATLLLAAVMAFWWWQYQGAPSQAVKAQITDTSTQLKSRDHDDDD